ncbi:iron ABC transporter permease [Rhizobium sp. P32RR-XVIII]|uniref:lipocalin-like domain-containing protein n=1 Tax=Rhizobium sp. P32RR-XVIII TaxID=2726738 RepID=UPI001456EBA4|nr:lipocalin-like domain-containing protein [Rhizobium sp. P32RR-XVIII]NLS04761.1 iron ABC transporter permease [Rhizobium sp. P32RR-XVIII]
MNAKSMLAAALGLVFLFSAAGEASPQGFAGLGTSAEGFAIPKPGTEVQFPADHGPHPDFRIEWWYVTANLKGADGKDYGAQWTLFRSAMAPGEKSGWASPQVWLAHAAITTSAEQHVAERLARGGVGQAGVTTTPFAAWIDNWHMKNIGGPRPGDDELSNLEISATGKDFGYSLNLQASEPPVLQGENGYSVKSAAGQASFYYSQPFYKVNGTLALPKGRVEVTGLAWLDHEWSSQPLSAEQTGWDWFSLHLDTGEKIMGFRLRDQGSGYTSATWISKDGRPTPLKPDALRVTPLATAKVANRDIPIKWRVEIPEHGFSITTTPLNPSAWMATRTPYWEGPITFEGTTGGRGYLEMTGY